MKDETLKSKLLNINTELSKVLIKAENNVNQITDQCIDSNIEEDVDDDNMFYLNNIQIYHSEINERINSIRSIISNKLNSIEDDNNKQKLSESIKSKSSLRLSKADSKANSLSNKTKTNTKEKNLIIQRSKSKAIIKEENKLIASKESDFLISGINTKPILYTQVKVYQVEYSIPTHKQKKIIDWQCFAITKESSFEFFNSIGSKKNLISSGQGLQIEYDHEPNININKNPEITEIDDMEENKIEFGQMANNQKILNFGVSAHKQSHQIFNNKKDIVENLRFNKKNSKVSKEINFFIYKEEDLVLFSQSVSNLYFINI